MLRVHDPLQGMVVQVGEDASGRLRDRRESEERVRPLGQEERLPYLCFGVTREGGVPQEPCLLAYRVEGVFFRLAAGFELELVVQLDT